MKRPLAILAAAGLALAAGSAAAAPPHAKGHRPAESCFRSSDIRNHTIADGRTLYLSTSHREVFRVGMSGSCLSGTMPGDPLVIQSTPGSMMICRPVDFDVGISRHGMTSPCIVDSITKLTPAQVSALPRKLRP